MTYFEALTALAFLWFADNPVALGVFEVGMGGTWDATNLVSGDVAVICPIGLDHPELGSTIAEVAGEKAGIIKQGKVAVVREQEAEALEVHRATVRGADRDAAARGPRVGGLGRLTVAVGGRRSRSGAPRDVRRPAPADLRGARGAQRRGRGRRGRGPAGTRRWTATRVRLALGATTSPGRLEVAARRPLVIFDGAHNPAAARGTRDALPDTFTWDRLHLVMGVFTDKDLDGIVAPIAPLADAGYATAVDSVRARSPQEVAAALAVRRHAAEPFPSVAEALDAAARAAVRGRPHPGDGLSVHCRGRPPGAPGGPLR